MALYEKRLSSLSELSDELKTLDADGGIRIRGTFEGRPCFVFVTKYKDEFGVSVYSIRKGGTGLEVPERPLEFRHFSKSFEVIEFVKGVALEPLEVCSY